jgi:hypothetical protein
VTTTIDSTRLDAEVAERLEFVTRWTRSIRHDLGNVLYPSQKLIAEVSEAGGRPAELAERVDDLMHMVNGCRSALTNVRPVEAGHAGGAVVPAEWWREVRHLMKAASNPRTRVDGPSERDIALPVSSQGLTMLALSILLAVEIQCRQPAPESISIGVRSDPESITIHVRGGGEPSPRLPAIALQIAERLECQLDTRWSAGQWSVVATLTPHASA